MGTVPTDSTLRRHYEQMQHAARLVPTDSVLRRHYGQMRQAARSSTGSSPAPKPVEPAAPPGEPSPTGRPAPAPEPAASGRGGGFFGWLKRLFGG